MKRILTLSIFAIFSLIIFSGTASAQLKLNVRVSADNQFRYGNGQEIITTFSNPKTYFEELGQVRLFVNDFTAGVRYELDDPIEFGKGTKGISSRYLQFKKDEFDVTAGNYYDLYGRGLSFNAFENRGLGINLQMDGLRVNYKKTFGRNIKFDAKIIAGDMTYVDFQDTSRTEKYAIRSGNFTLSPFKYATIGGSYLFAKGEIPLGSFINDITAEIFEGDLALNYKGIDFFTSYANKKTITVPNALFAQSQGPRGDGLYSSIAYTRTGFGITLDYKNYRFNVVKPNERSTSSPVKPLPFQVAPAAIKEYSSTLLSRYPHTVDFGDEVGFQLDAIYNPNDHVTLNFNASLSSRHYDYTDIDTTVLTSYKRVDRSNAFLPSTKDPLSPYWELYFEVEYYARKNMTIKIAAGRQSSVVYSIVDPSSSDKIRATTIPVEIKYDFLKLYSIKAEIEQQWVYNSLRAATQTNFYNEYISLALSRSPSLVLAGSMEFSTDKEDPSGKKFWASGEITYKFNSSNTATLSYGSERGGLKCTSGICRYVNPFKGFRLTITNNFN